MRAALAWAVDADERELGLELVVALENWWVTSSPQEAGAWIEALLGDASDIPEGLVVRALRVQGGMENMLGEPELADERWEHALRIAQATGQEQAVAVLQHRLADMARRLRETWRVRERSPKPASRRIVATASERARHRC